MADNPDITAGTASVVAGTKEVTGVGTFWSTDEIRSGDLFASDGYPGARIDTVNSDTSIALRDNWRGSSLPAGSSYYIRYQPDGSRYAALLAAVRKILTQPILTAFSGLSATADKLPFFTGASTMGLMDFKVWARSFLGLPMAEDKLPYGTSANTMGLVDFKAWARSLLGQNMAADKLPYGTGSDTMGLVDFKAWARSLLGLAPAADKGIYFADANTATTYTLTAYARTLLGENNGAGVWTKLGGASNTSSIKHPDGTIEQWGVIYNAASDYGLTFPLAFPSVCYAVTMTPYINAGLGAAYVAMTSNTSRTGTDVRCRNITGAGVGQQNDLVVFWKAVGK